ncbi:MAG: hypothetical protein JWL81_647 [Verrucomicrobiales bacterium]|nr:hypothetical protein [Verrucomicrobiales bacterium]
MSDHLTDSALHQTRRQWLGRSGLGLGSLALSSLLAQGKTPGPGGLPGLPHFAPKAKRVIFLFMSGGMSQLESFDYKPLLIERNNKPLPDSVLRGRPVLGMSKNQGSFVSTGSPFPFARHGQSGAWLSSCFPHLAKQADRICFLKGMVSDAVNHDPAIIFMNSGAQLPGRPCMGSWLNYGLGSENSDLPGFIVLVTKKPADQPLSGRLWSSGFLPASYQGVPFRSGREPVLFLTDPPGLPPALRQSTMESMHHVQTDTAARRQDPAMQARIDQYELAFRMQMSVPDAVSLTNEAPATLERYGPEVGIPGSFAANCVLARRLCEKGVRFVQLYHPGWDHHGQLPELFAGTSKEVDQPAAALLQDLADRDMLKDTLVVFGTEFGRTCYAQGNPGKEAGFGREHHRSAFSFWLAGAGVKAGISHGVTDDFGFDVVDGKVTVNDLHATLLHLLGIDHERFTYPFQGRDFRLTDVAGKLVSSILA